MGISSMKSEAQKTAILFHAKDDAPEVRLEVYRLLSRHHFKAIAAVKDKQKVLHYALNRRAADSGYRYNPNELYDFLARRIFRENLHLAKSCEICFAIRGNKPRTTALGTSLEIAQRKFMDKHGIQQASTLSIVPKYSRDDPCLQAVDYLLWALQRLYELREDRYFETMKDFYSLIIDIDDTRRHEYGEYFNQGNPLNLSSIKPL
jgi:hypothetical protein